MTETKAIIEQSKDIKLVEWFDSHWYKIEFKGETHYLPSVTTKLSIKEKPWLARWRGDIGNREADMKMYEAGERGKRIHWAWEQALTGGMVIYDPWNQPNYTEGEISALKAAYGDKLAILRTQDEMYQITKLKAQFEALQPIVMGVEMKVYDLEGRDAGTIDSVLKVKEGDYLISGKQPVHLEEGIYINDLKTGSVVDDGVWLQIAPYAVMFEKMFDVEVAGGLVTHTSAAIKTGIKGLKTMVRDRKTLIERDYQDYRYAAKLWERDHQGEQPETFTFPAAITLKLNKGE